MKSQSAQMYESDNSEVQIQNDEKATPMISIVVPVYKVEKYLFRCINSIINQTYKNIEIILVDDGSPDNCGNICDEFASKDNRIRVIHKENGGQSSARNAGLDLAQGDYVGFVDSDDYIDTQMYEQLMNIALETNADIVECECRAGKSDNFSVFGKNTKTLEVYNNMEALEKLYFGEQINGIACMVWDKIYKRHLFDKVRFFDGYDIGEDSNITPKLLFNSDKIVKYNYNYYNYCIESPDSSSLSENIKKYTDPVFLGSDLCSFFKCNNLDLYQDIATVKLLNSLFECRYQYAIRKMREGISETDIKIKTLLPDVANNKFVGRGLKWKIILYKISPSFLQCICTILKNRKNK